MFVIYGLREFGTLEREDGTVHGTRCFHLYFMPLFPVGGVETLPDGTTRPEPIDLKSLALAYARMWGFAAALAIAASGYLKLENDLGPGLLMMALTAAVLFGTLSLWLWVGDRQRPSPRTLALAFGIPCLVLGYTVYRGIKENQHRASSNAYFARQRPADPKAIDAFLTFAEQQAMKERAEKNHQLRVRCDTGEAKACNDLAFGLEKSDLPGALAAWRKACDAGIGAACVNVARAVEKTDPPGALAAWRKACDGGLGAACFNAALAVEKTDADAANALYDQACTHGVANGCNNFAVGLQTKEPKKAVELFDRACTLKSGLGCRNLARFYEKGTGVKKDKAKTVALRSRACELGDTVSCGR